MTTTAPTAPDVVYREDLNVSGLHVREDTETGTREVSGIAVPYGVDASIRDWFGDYIERFEKGAVQDSDDALLYWRHNEPIGKITAARDTDTGWEITATISTTPRGDEAYQLAKDGVIREFSIGFQPLDHREEVQDGTTVIVRTRVKVREVSLVPFGAFGKDAPVSNVREDSTPNTKETPMTADTVTRADLTDIHTGLENLERKVDALPTQTPGPAPDQFRSIGDMVKRIAAGDDAAIRAYNGAVSGDAAIQDAWLGDFTEIIKKRRPMLETFATGTLPGEGMNVEYARLNTDTTQAGVQANEGDDLLFGKVALTVDTAPVKTVGGYSSLSRQAIERANLNLLDTTWEALAEKQGQATEAYVRSIFNTAVAATGGAALATVEVDLTTQDGIVTAVLDTAEHFENVGRSLDGLFVDKATFLAIYGVAATDRVLQVNGAPTDKVGTITVKTASGSVAGLEIRVLPGAAANTRVAYDATAIKTLESGGMPFRLQDDNVVNLSRDLSMYGYIASFIQKRAGLVKLIDAA